MSNQTAEYIINYFPRLLTDKEQVAIRHIQSLQKLDNSNSDETDEQNLRRTNLYIEKGWLTEDKEVLELLKDGIDQFELNILTRVMNEDADNVYFNNCPKCGQLAKTPQARQCRYCGHSWHNIKVAEFKIKSSFQLTNRPFFILGEILSGHLNKGNFIDLTFLGLNKKPEIVAVEFALHRTDGKSWEDIGLGTSELSEEEKEFLKDKSFTRTIDILNQRN